nr:hypothetical protein [Pseudobutyrivibrio sp.]
NNVASTVSTNTSSYNEVANVADVASVVSFNEDDTTEEANTIIEDETVPLSVNMDNDSENARDGSVTITDEETPLAMQKSGLDGRSWWYWILIIISIITGKVAIDKRDNAKEAADTSIDK